MSYREKRDTDAKDRPPFNTGKNIGGDKEFDLEQFMELPDQELWPAFSQFYEKYREELDLFINFQKLVAEEIIRNQKEKELSKHLTLEVISKETGLNVRKLRQLCREEKIERLKEGNIYYITREAVQAWLSKKKTKSNP